MKVIHQVTKTLITRDNGRSADAISPNLIYGCLGGCMKSYCYVGRFNHDKVYVNQNTAEILQSIETWVEDKPWPKVPNQTDAHRYTIDIGCSTDIPLMQKHLLNNAGRNSLEEVLVYFRLSEKAKATFATKYPSMFASAAHQAYTSFLHPLAHRIRVSLMPQVYSDVLEPNTDSIHTRIDQIKRLQDLMEVHINFSPIIYTPGWTAEYRKLFQLMKDRGIGDISCECIFLTYNDTQHVRNDDKVNELLWRPDIQEKKDSQYAADNLRYNHQLKRKLVSHFVSVYSEYYNPENIRYIF